MLLNLLLSVANNEQHYTLLRSPFPLPLLTVGQVYVIYLILYFKQYLGLRLIRNIWSNCPLNSATDLEMRTDHA